MPRRSRLAFATAGIALATSIAVPVAWGQTPHPAGPEFVVNAYTPGEQFFSTVAVEPDGDFVVAWTDSGADGDSTGVFARRFSANGAPRGGQFRINAYTTGHQHAPAIAVGAGGDFVVVWKAQQGVSYSGVQTRRFDAAGAPLNTEFHVAWDQSYPHVARAPDGKFLVTWTTYVLDGNDRGVAAQLFNAGGTPAGPAFVVNTFTPGTQSNPKAAVDGAGNFVVAWLDSSGHDGSDWGVFAQRLDAAGGRIGAEFLVPTTTAYKQFAPEVSFSPTGEFVVVWTSDPSGTSNRWTVQGRRFDASGQGIGGEFRIDTFTGLQVPLMPMIDHDANGNFVVVWETDALDAGDVVARRFDAAGMPVGAEVLVNVHTTGWQMAESVGVAANGDFVVTWTDRTGQDGSASGVFARRFRPGSHAPVALAADAVATSSSNGNRVLEPGEEVRLQPTWRNDGAAAQPFPATLSDPSGPAGAAYTITDATGDYGVIGPGGIATCADCFGFHVSDAQPRPTVHWDASVRETGGSPVSGVHTWKLHLGRSFSDVPPASPFYRFVETLLHRGVTGGCAATTYCPSASTTRAQMAVFVLVAREGADYVPPACTTPAFPDVPPSSPFCRWVEELARRGVVGGCGGGSYCPSADVARDQMAVFVLRTLEPTLNPPACTTPMFADLPASHPFCHWVEELARRGIVSGCGGGNYCPAAPVTREQMGVFIGVTFALTLYGP